LAEGFKLFAKDIAFLQFPGHGYRAPLLTHLGHCHPYKSLITSLIELMLSIALRTADAISALRSMKDCESMACTLTEIV
jgi:hypothetical protein